MVAMVADATRCCHCLPYFSGACCKHARSMDRSVNAWKLPDREQRPLQERRRAQTAAIRQRYLNTVAGVLALAEKDLHELRTYTSPPAAVEAVLGAVCFVLGLRTDWESAMALMHSTVMPFITRIQQLDLESVSPARAAQLAQLVAEPDLQPARARAASAAAHSLALWVHAVHEHVCARGVRAEAQRRGGELEARQTVTEVRTVTRCRVAAPFASACASVHAGLM